MTAPRKGSRLAIAMPLATALATALALLPNISASAADTAAPRAATTADGTALSYVVNVRPGHGTSARVQKAVADAGGTVVTSYDQIGVIVVHSSDADFAKTIRKVRGVESAGNTRNAPLPAQSTTDVGTPKPLTARQVANAEAADGQDPLAPLQWDLPAIKADKAHEKSLGSRKVTVAVIDGAVCEGSKNRNGFYGWGTVDALDAVTK